MMFWLFCNHGGCRKLTEVGFKRTPQECKEKFEEERRYSNIDDTSDDHIIHYNARMFSELEEFYRHGHDNHDDDHHEHVSSEAQEHNQNKRQKLLGEPRTQEKDKVGQEQDPNKEEEEEGEEDDDDNDDKMGKSGNIENEGKPSSPISSSAMVMMMEKKRKRKRKGFEVLKGICEGMVRSMIAQQEEMHKKILEDMTKREEEKIAREETWKKRETERINKELEIRAHEQALASDRNSTIIKFITKFTSVSDDDDDHHHHRHVYEVQSPKTSQSSSCLVPPQTPSSNIPSLSSSQTLTPHNHLYLKHTDDKSLDPNSVQTLRRKTNNPITPKSDKNSDLGKRWPRDEVLALVNIRCRISTKINVNHHHHHREDHHHKDGPSTSKAPSLWERVSEKMLELGYDRSAKRCKEKWENINKYFKKTKNVNKKRPLDSRTCPYFHQLNELYNQGSLAGTNTAAGKVDSGCQYPETRPE